MARRHREQVRPEALLHQRPDAGEPVAADLFLARSQQGEQRRIRRGIGVHDATGGVLTRVDAREGAGDRMPDHNGRLEPRLLDGLVDQPGNVLRRVRELVW